jgi:hypothetical protein
LLKEAQNAITLKQTQMWVMLFRPFGFPAPKNHLAFHIFTMRVPDECEQIQNGGRCHGNQGAKNVKFAPN